MNMNESASRILRMFCQEHKNDIDIIQQMYDSNRKCFNYPGMKEAFFHALECMRYVQEEKELIEKSAYKRLAELQYEAKKKVCENDKEI